MSVCVHYWAIPPKSRLYGRLQTDRTFKALMAFLFPYGGGIYHFFDIDQEEVKEILDGLVQDHRAVLGPERKARQRINEFLAEVKRTRAENPGIENRAAMLEKCSLEIEERLAQALQKVRSDGADLIRKLMSGDKILDPHYHQESILGLVSRSLVQKGAAVLKPLEPESVFPSKGDPEKWYGENYSWWRQVWLEAAKHEEEILVGVT